MDNKFQMVIARYNEDIRWLLPYKDIVLIYNKGDYNPLLHKFNVIYLNNVGRESHTYLYHIIQNYYNLADHTIFFQGNITDHHEKILDIEDYFKENDFIGKTDKYPIQKLKDDILHFGKYKKDINNGSLKKSNYTPFNWLINIIGLDINNSLIETNVVWNANFALSKKIIHLKPIEFYQNIIRQINNHPNPEEGHFLERSWYLIFHSNYNPKPTIKYMILNNSIQYNNFITNDKYNIDDIYHIWLPVIANYDIGINYKIYFIKSINKYITINTPIINNSFNISIKSSNDISILIDFENNNYNNNHSSDNTNTYDSLYNEYNKYEILLGVFNNTKAILRNCISNKIIHSYENKILDNDNYIDINFTLDIDNNIIIKKNDDIIFNFKNNFEYSKIKSIKLKNNGKYYTYLSYKHVIDNTPDNIKLCLTNNLNENINISNFYNNHFHKYYIEEIKYI